MIEIIVSLAEPRKPEIEDTNLIEQELKLSLGEPFRLFCNIVGLPDPEIKWYKNGLPIDYDDRISLSADNQTLDIKYLREEDDGEFKCTGENRLGYVENASMIKITSKTQSRVHRIYVKQSLH